MSERELSAAVTEFGLGNRVDAFCRRAVLDRLDVLACGSLRIDDADGCWVLAGQKPGPEARVHVHDSKFWRLLATGGSVGAGEAYIAGAWDAPDLVAVIRVLAANRSVMDRMEQGGARLYGWLLKLLHRFSRNSLTGARRNIAAHYDLGNEFFRAWLDPRMQYSSGLFRTAEETLEQSQLNKLERIVERLQISAADHVLEIGSGWGGLAIHLASSTGCRVTTTTISREQHAWAVERVAEAGLGDRVEVLLQDYRELTGQFDKLVSVEMIEAVGAEYLETYLATIEQRLKPDGLALIQAITIEDHRYRNALASVDFIKRYIFPGSFIPSVSAITGAMARAGSLGLVELFDMGESYARTLRHWRQRFEAAWEAIHAMGFDEGFRRRWRFYLAYCEGGFDERAISNVQLLLAGPEWRKALPVRA
ncbi:MAG: cyclopropane-fatty-acyl-phospholipid synthase family protein [Wenzhouxiangellaceae bacterium]|nr:cyclopropane-fatty-acyl-phospholipid synthase family protein [Wenzhouxiangellaceae bacterium]